MVLSSIFTSIGTIDIVLFERTIPPNKVNFMQFNFAKYTEGTDDSHLRETEIFLKKCSFYVILGQK